MSALAAPSPGERLVTFELGGSLYALPVAGVLEVKLAVGLSKTVM